MLSAAAPAGAASGVTALEPAGRQALDAGYERVFGTARGVVDGSERVRGLPVGGLSYAVEYEILRPTGGARPRLLLVEAENRGSPLLLDALGDLEPGASGAPSAATYPASASRILRRERLAYARVQWQTGIAASVPATAQGVGEVIMRDFARALRATAPRRALIGVSQGAFFVTTFLAEGFNALPGGGRAYDQMLTVDGNGNWMAINGLAGSAPEDPYVRQNGRPLPYRVLLHRPRTDPLLVDVANYTDFYRLRAGLTGRGRVPRQGATLRLAVAAPVLLAGDRLRRPALQRRARGAAQPPALRAVSAGRRARDGARTAAGVAALRPRDHASDGRHVQRAARREGSRPAHRTPTPSRSEACASPRSSCRSAACGRCRCRRS